MNDFGREVPPPPASDPPPAPPTPPTMVTPDRGGRRRGPRVLVGLVFVLVLAGAVVATIVAIHDSRVAIDWRDRARDTGDQLAALQAAYEDLQGAHDDATARAQEAAERIVELEQRTVTLADEKARAGDRATIAEVDGATAAAVADQLDACTGDLIGVFTAIGDARTQEEIDVIAANFQATATRCEAAAASARGLGDFLAPGHGG